MGDEEVDVDVVKYSKFGMREKKEREKERCQGLNYISSDTN